MSLGGQLCITSRPCAGVWLKDSILPSFQRIWYVILCTHNSVQELSIALVDSRAKVVAPSTTHPLQCILDYMQIPPLQNRSNDQIRGSIGDWGKYGYSKGT